MLYIFWILFQLLMLQSGIILICFCFLNLFELSFSYRPIICVHGVGGSYHTFDDTIKWIQELHPGTEVYSLDFYNNYESYAGFKYQIPFVIELLRKTREEHDIEDGYILLSHSQGSVISRALLHMMDDHGVGTWISLAGPLSGQYGIPNINLPKEFEFLLDFTLEEVTEILYLKLSQHLISFADYWQCPFKHKEYLLKNLYLPIWNNQTFNPNSQNFKTNFMKVSKMMFFGSPSDDQIKPWQSEHWSFYEKGNLNRMIPMEEQVYYVEDSFGLKSLDEQGRVALKTVEGVPHNDWVHVKNIFVRNVLPFLN